MIYFKDTNFCVGIFMKLFKSLLVAPATLVFYTLTANASEVNLNEIANYSDIER